MSGYSDFAEKLLIALYQETEDTGDPFQKAGLLIEKYGLYYKPLWIANVADEWEGVYLSDVSKVLSGYEAWSFRLSARGTRYIEEKYGDKDGVGEILQPVQTSPAVQVDKLVAPASDRVVSFNHNELQFEEIATGLRDMREAVREVNDLAEPERDRLLKSLDAAQSLWQAIQLKIIQVKVGVLLAVEDLVPALTGTVKAVAAALLVDTIKAFVKAQTGIDLDHI